MAVMVPDLINRLGADGWGAMVERENIVTRRAYASDGERIARFVNRALGGRVDIDAQAVTMRTGDVAFFLAEQDGRLAGLLGWHVEDLVVRVTDLLLWSGRERVQIARALLEAMESAAVDLQAEAAFLLLPRSGGPVLVEFCRALGYEPRLVAELPTFWRETAHQAGRADDETLLLKQLRSDHVVRPL